MTIAVDLGRKATKQTKHSTLVKNVKVIHMTGTSGMQFVVDYSLFVVAPIVCVCVCVCFFFVLFWFLVLFYLMFYFFCKGSKQHKGY